MSARRVLVERRDLYRIPLWLAARVALSLFPIPLLLALSRVRGTVLSVVSRERHRVARELERSFPATASTVELRRLIRRHFQFLKVNEVVRLGPQLRGFDQSRAFQIDGLSNLDAALAEGKGAILLTAHLGYGKLIKPLLASRGYVILTVGRGRSDPALWAYSRLGYFVRTSVLRLPPREDQEAQDLEGGINLRPHVTALASNQVLVIPGDGEDARSTHRVDLLGRSIGFAPGVISLARTSGAAVLPTLAIDATERVGQGIRLELRPRLPLPASATPAEALLPFIQFLDHRLEAYPHLWRWGNRYLDKHERASQLGQGGQVKSPLGVGRP